MAEPSVRIDAGAIEHNARVIVQRCARHGIAVTGVTKGTCGHPAVARAMLRGGVTSIGESRLENIRRLRGAGVHAPIVLLRVPSLSQADETVASADVSLNSELSVVEALSAAAAGRSGVHRIVVMVDLGDLREGVWPDDLAPFVRDVLRMPGVRLHGLGTSLSCYGGVVPGPGNMRELVEHARMLESTFGITLDWLSAGATSALALLERGEMPARVNHLRIGEGILLGVETVHREPIPGTRQDAFELRAEIIELKHKPSLPRGERGQDAFGHVPEFENHGEIDRAIVNVGREDVDVGSIRPLDARLRVLGASSDQMVVDVSAACGELRVGDTLSFALGYPALLACMTSRYVHKRVTGADGE